MWLGNCVHRYLLYNIFQVEWRGEEETNKKLNILCVYSKFIGEIRIKRIKEYLCRSGKSSFANFISFCVWLRKVDFSSQFSSVCVWNEMDIGSKIN